MQEAFEHITNPGSVSARLNRCRKSVVRYGLLSICVAMLIFSHSSMARAESSSLEYKIKAAYIYNFTKFITWPDEVFAANGNSGFNICIYKHNPFEQTLELLNDKVVNGHQLLTKLVETENKLDRCQIVFIPRALSDDYPRILERLSGKSILTVSDIEEFARNGGHIGLDTINGKVRFEINLGATRVAGLKVSAKLLELAIAVIE